MLIGTNGTGLLVSYDAYSEPSAPVEEPMTSLQVFGLVNGKFVSFGPTLEIEGGLLDKYGDVHSYKAARPLGAQADVIEFKIWAGHCRLVYPVRVDWSQGKLSPVQECNSTAGNTEGGLTFVRLWPAPEEKSVQPMKTVVKKDSKVDLLIADTAANSKASPADTRNFDPTVDTNLWLKVRIDGKEGWMHSE